MSALLVELDEGIAEVARKGGRAAELEGVRMVCADAAMTDAYEGAVPADIVLACGVFGNISEEDIRTAIDWLPSLCAPAATVIWTRGGHGAGDVALSVRQWFGERGFAEVAYESPAGETFRVGVHRLVNAPRPFERGVRIFTFVR